MNRVIFHVDVNSAFLSWEAVFRIYYLGAKIDLREVASAVGGDQEKRHGIILAKSIPAKKYGIETGESIIEAKRKCRDLILVPPNYDLYARCSHSLMCILREYSDKIEQYSIDEAFLDMTGLKEDPVVIANELRDRIYNELGFTVNIGVSQNKVLAKMASDFKKPNYVHTLWQNEIAQKMWPLSVGKLFYVGQSSQKKLHTYGIYTIGELAAASRSMLKIILKSHGLLIHDYANGIDFTPVINNPPEQKAYGNSLTTAHDVCNMHMAKLYLLSLAETISARLRMDKVKVGEVAVNLKDCNFHQYSHQHKLVDATDLTIEIYNKACICLEEMWDGIPLRSIGIHTRKVNTSAERQLTLFDKIDYDKHKRVEQAIDEIRKRHGIDSVMRASFLPYQDDADDFIDHMGGGISREKRTVDYENEQII